MFYCYNAKLDAPCYGLLMRQMSYTWASS